jgi:polysaccharide export outer membrane protein
MKIATTSPSMNRNLESNAKRKAWLPGLFAVGVCRVAALCLAAWVVAGCAGDAPRYPDLSALSVPPAVAATNRMAALDDTHKLAIGDHLTFRILEDKDDLKALYVTDSGDIEVPYLGRVPAEGKTCKTLAADLKKGLEKEYYRHATVVLAVDSMTKSRGKVYLSGPVRIPGPQEIPSDEVFTLSKAILRAGGFGDFADKRKVKVTRKSHPGEPEQTFTVDVGQILEKGRNDLDLTLEAGDMVYVPERTIRF